MSSVCVVSADELRANVRFEDQIEPISRAFQEFSAGLAHNGLIVMFPAERPDLGEVYAKTGTLHKHPIFIVKISPWFAVNHEQGQAQGGFVGVFDSQTGHTLALLNDAHEEAAGLFNSRFLVRAKPRPHFFERFLYARRFAPRIQKPLLFFGVGVRNERIK